MWTAFRDIVLGKRRGAGLQVGTSANVTVSNGLTFCGFNWVGGTVMQ